MIYKKVLTIAGSDSGGGAGIQADIKTFSAIGCYGCSAITATTAQNTCGVTDIHPIPLSHLEAQIRAVLDDIGADAIKIGMLHTSERIRCVARLITEYHCNNIVIDPVMVATSGDRLIEENAVAPLKSELLPLATLITPNVPELELLTERFIANQHQLEEAAKELQKDLGCSVLAKGAHLEEDTFADILFPAGHQEPVIFKTTRIATTNTHGTGCTLSSAVAAFLARGETVEQGVRLAILYLREALKKGATYTLGKGHGPVHHFHDFWE